MFSISCISSGSTANMYLLETATETLIVDAGVSFLDIQRNGNISNWENIVGILCSHNHSDHNKAIPDFKKLGFACYDVDNMFINKIYDIGNFKVMPMLSKHNIKCYSFWIRIEDKNILYITDTTKIPDLVDIEFDCVIMETNWINDMNIAEGWQNHLSLEQVEAWINSRKYKPQLLIAHHISHRNACKKIIKERLDKIVNCELAERGKKWIIKQ